ncbi:hypothetical protein [Croceimicrobium sp.]|uniref:hypothetical protein n=1 Tax=Croceimicrobium sp. TaxID=2828340 RepID=UPI003BA99706
MKSLKIFFLALGLSTGTVFAGNDSLSTEQNVQNQVSRQISSRFQIPSELVGQMHDKQAIVQIEVGENHQLKVLSVDCGNGVADLLLKKALEKLAIYLPEDSVGQSFELLLNLRY